MADIRINALATTAASTASDDFIAVDGSANGTRKLNAYSPTFGGNLTVSGTGTTGGNLSVRNALGYATGIHTGTTSDSTQQLLLSSNAAYNHAYISKGSTALGIGFSSDNGSFVADDSITITAATKLVTLAGNLTVNGTGTSNIGGVPSTGLATYSGNLRIQSTGNGPATVNGIELQNSQSGSGYGYKIYTNNSNDYIGIAGRFGSATWTEFLAIKQNTGNVLIGTTTDGGQKLQVNGTIRSGSGSGETLSAGSIDVGADIGIASTQGIVQGGARIVTFTSGNATFAGWASIRGTGSGSAQWIGDDGADGWFLNVPTSNVITLGINNTARVVIKANTVQIVNLPTSSSGLNPGDLWNDSGTVKIA